MTDKEQKFREDVNKLRESAETMELLLLGAVAKLPESQREDVRRCKAELEAAIEAVKARYEPTVFGAADAILTAEQMAKG